MISYIGVIGYSDELSSINPMKKSQVFLRLVLMRLQAKRMYKAVEF